ncbi:MULTISPECIES: TetR/AcrR family transcriptional regulator [Chryseobacterium group]|uniref:TetR/AcrR family transcriptional regulator n=1 Tax=Chryseobacterium group TaxID=2782232 RepID=UPI0012A9896D|nr:MULTISPECIES: TetR/AcrR family transcriptional regulator [Chryseobacterium group]MDF0719014.1 TetR/AcrR family transcriptional regulator [Kaistella sp. PBT33-4]QFG54187.1 TetR/AcrR family transcriptional regulator [Chryseobacterium sp.]
MGKKFTEKQKHILNIAEELIAQKGFEGTSVRDISARANINVAMISYYFGSKEKMMYHLYHYRVQRTREHFAEFADIIKDGKPEMQMREIIKYIVGQLFKYGQFHGFVSQELRRNETLKQELLAFYQFCVKKLDEVLKKGIASGVFTFAPKPEDILSIILGTTLFSIRNKNFMEVYVGHSDEQSYLKEAEKKVKANMMLTVFALLGFVQD